MRNSRSNEIDKESKTNTAKAVCDEGLFNQMMTRAKNLIALRKATSILLIKRIVTVRFKSSTVINNFFRGIKVKKGIRDATMLYSIINQRRSAAELIQINYRRYLNSKRFHSLYDKVKNCYSIYPSISKTNHSIVMRVFTHDQCKQIKVKYCSLRKAFVVDIPKLNVSKTRQLKINYFINNQVIIDPTLKTRCDNGQYVNVLDFDALEKKVERQRQMIFEGIATYSKRKWSTNESSTTTNAEELHFDESETIDEVYFNNNSNDICDEEKAKRRRGKGLKTVKINEASMTLDKPIRSNRKHMTVKTDMSMIKSILKPCMSSSSSGRCLNSKKVCFGKVQFSF